MPPNQTVGLCRACLSSTDMSRMPSIRWRQQKTRWHYRLGVSALAGIWFLAIYMLGLGFSVALQVVIARRNGEQKYEETGKTFFQGLCFLLILASLLCLLSKFFSPLLLRCWITSSEVYNAVIMYLDWRIVGLFFSFPFR